MFKKLKDEYGDYYYTKKIKLENGKTLEVSFHSLYENDLNIYFDMDIVTYKKRKQKEKSRLSTYRDNGIKTLLLARNILLEFEEFIKLECYKTNIFVEIYWSSIKRRNCYYRGLKKYGYVFKQGIYSSKCLSKCLRK